jgi:hypothetical protein
MQMNYHRHYNYCCPTDSRTDESDYNRGASWLLRDLHHTFEVHTVDPCDLTLDLAGCGGPFLLFRGFLTTLADTVQIAAPGIAIKKRLF